MKILDKIKELKKKFNEWEEKEVVFSIGYNIIVTNNCTVMLVSLITLALLLFAFNG
jgi:hypothetical protein